MKQSSGKGRFGFPSCQVLSKIASCTVTVLTQIFTSFILHIYTDCQDMNIWAYNRHLQHI